MTSEKSGLIAIDVDGYESAEEVSVVAANQEPEEEGDKLRSDLMLYAVWKRFSYRINGNLSLKGHSRAAEKTCFVIPELGLYFDGALQCYIQPLVMCITHCHSDHSTAIPMILTAIDTKPTIYVPKKAQPLFNNYLQAHYQLTKGTDRVRNQRYIMVGKEPGDCWREQIKDRIWEIQTFECYHSVPTLGYGLSQVKNKISADIAEKIANMPRKQIGNFMRECRENGVITTEESLEPIIVYLCDTTFRVFQDEEIFKYPRIIVECTNLYEEHEHYARKNKHICWTQIRDTVKAHPDNIFILIHFSMRYSWEEIDTFFEKEQKEHNIQNIYVWRN